MHSELHVANIFCSYMYIKDLQLIINFSIDQYQSMQQKWISESMKTSTSNATFTLELIKMAVFRTSCKSSNAIQLMLLACLSSFLILKSQTKRKLQWIQFFQTHRSCSRINIHVYKYPSCSLISCRRQTKRWMISLSMKTKPPPSPPSRSLSILLQMRRYISSTRRFSWSRWSVNSLRESCSRIFCRESCKTKNRTHLWIFLKQISETSTKKCF